MPVKKLLALCLFLAAAPWVFPNQDPDLRVGMRSYPRSIESKSQTQFEVTITNREEEWDLENLNFRIIGETGFTMVPDRTRIPHLGAGETALIILTVSSDRNHYFRDSVWVTFEVAGENYRVDNRFLFTIEPLENFWLLVVLGLSAVCIAVFTVLFIRLNREDSDAGQAA
ncbi:MAG: hypothetical protein FWH12_01915 [Treponema sp.]|nr:hypothetical protein [Treponema sp.]